MSAKSVRWPVGVADWQAADAYAGLLMADRAAFAWEWLRRSAGYRYAWRLYRDDAQSCLIDPRGLGLERFEDPALATPTARAFWSASIDHVRHCPSHRTRRALRHSPAAAPLLTGQQPFSTDLNA